MLEQAEQLSTQITESPDHHWFKTLSVYTGVAVATMAAYVGVGYKADSNFGVERAAQLVEANGFQHPHLLSKKIGFVSLEGCRNLDEVKYTFEVDESNGTPAVVSVCRGLGKESAMTLPQPIEP